MCERESPHMLENSSHDTDASGGRDYPTSTTGISSRANRQLTKCSGGLSCDHQMKSTQETETNPPGMKVEPDDHGCFSAILTKLRRRPTNSSRVKPERSPVDVAGKACGLDKDLNEEVGMKSPGKEATVPWVSGTEVTRALTQVPSRRRRYITAMLNFCGIRWSVSFTHDIAPPPSAVTVPSTITGTLPENKDELHKEQMKAPGREGTPPLPAVQLSRRNKYISATLKRLGSLCGQHHEISDTFQPQTVVTAEKACGTQDDVDMFEDSTEDDLDIGDLDNDDIVNELEIHDIYEANMDDLSSDTSLHSFKLDTDSSYKSSRRKDDSSSTSMKSSDYLETNAVPVGPPRCAWEDNRKFRK